MKKLILLMALLCSPCFADQGRITLVGPVGVDIKTGWSSWSTSFDQIQVNPLQVLFWTNGGKCSTIPITSVSVKYSNDTYWYDASYKDGYYYVDNKLQVTGVKLSFYLDGVAESCVISVSGFRNIGG